MQKYYLNPIEIEPFFDLANIRHKAQKQYTAHVKPLIAHTIAKHTFAPDAVIEIINPGTTELHFYLSQTKDAMPKADGIVLLPTQQGIFPATQLGNIEYAYLMVYNPHKVEIGQFEIYI